MTSHQPTILSIPAKNIRVDVHRIMGLLGYETKAQEDPTIRDMVMACLDEAKTHIHAKAAFILYPHDPELSNSNQITIHGVSFNTSRIVSAQLRRANQMALYLCTIGPDLETYSKHNMAEGDALKAYILDIIGSEAAESVAEHIHQKVRDLASFHQMHNTNRFSPGYCEWDVSEQHALFPLLPAEACGVQLSDSALMHPVKSTNGIIGIGPDLRESPYPCAYCNQLQCSFRTIRNTQEASNTVTA